MVKVLCTRPVPEELIEQAASKDITIEVKNFIAIQSRIGETDAAIIQAMIYQKNIAAIFTSKHAVHILADFIEKQKISKKLPEWNIYSISKATLKMVLKDFPFSIVRGQADYAVELAERITGDRGIKEVNFFCGNMRRDSMADTLNKYGIKVNEFIIYETRYILHHIKESYDGYIFFSPSAVDSFFSTNSIQDRSVCFAIGTTTMASIKSKTGNNIICSKEQDVTSMINEVINFYQ